MSYVTQSHRTPRWVSVSPTYSKSGTFFPVEFVSVIHLNFWCSIVMQREQKCCLRIGQFRTLGFELELACNGG